jgi:hypothetical protein
MKITCYPEEKNQFFLTNKNMLWTYKNMSEQCSNTGIYIGLGILIIGIIAIFYKVNNVDTIVMKQFGPPPTPSVVVVTPSTVASTARDPVPSRGASIPAVKPEEPKASPAKDVVTMMETSTAATTPTAPVAPATTVLPPASPAASTATAQVVATMKAAEKFRF